MFESTTQDIAYTLRAERAARRSFSTLALALAAYSAIAVIATALTSLILGLTGVSSLPFVTEHAAVFSLLLSTLPMYLFGLPVLFLIVRRVPTYPAEQQRVSLRFFLGVFLVSRFCMYAGSVISSYLQSWAETLHILPSNPVEEIVSQTPVWLLILIAVILAPIVEELIFRKVLIDRLRGFGDVTAILFSSLAFGLVHGNFFQLFYSVLHGIVLGYLYARTGRILPCILLHMITNFLGSVAILPLTDMLDRLTPYSNMPEEELSAVLLSPEGTAIMIDLLILVLYSILFYGLVIGGAVLLCMYARRALRELRPRLLSTVGRRRMLTLAFANVGVPIFLAITVIEFVFSLF